MPAQRSEECMKVSKKQLKQLIEQALNENDDPFAAKLAHHAQVSLEIVSNLKDHVFAAKQLAEKAKKYGAPSGDKLKQYDSMLNTLYEFARFLKNS